MLLPRSLFLNLLIRVLRGECCINKHSTLFSIALKSLSLFNTSLRDDNSSDDFLSVTVMGLRLFLVGYILSINRLPQVRVDFSSIPYIHTQHEPEQTYMNFSWCAQFFITAPAMRGTFINFRKSTEPSLTIWRKKELCVFSLAPVLYEYQDILHNKDKSIVQTMFDSNTMKWLVECGQLLKGVFIYSHQYSCMRLTLRVPTRKILCSGVTSGWELYGKCV